jgi:phenylalanine-4-hydroxylase
MNPGVPFAGTTDSTAPKAGAEDIVQLDQNHPGFRDPEYRARRNHIAQQALRWHPGDPVPDVQYTDTEQGVWRTVWEHLAPLHHKHASAEYKALLAAGQLLAPAHPPAPRGEPEARREPDRLPDGAGGRAGHLRAFLGNLRFDQFLSTQYIRHHTGAALHAGAGHRARAGGHAATLADPGFAELNRAFGHAAERVSEDVLKQIERVYWYTLEFGVAKEGEQLKAYGAGLLSSFGELERFQSPRAARAARDRGDDRPPLRPDGLPGGALRRALLPGRRPDGEPLAAEVAG